MSAAYRDPLAGLRSRIPLLRMEVKAMNSTFTGDLWALLSDDLFARIKELKAAALTPPGDTLESLSRAAASLEALRAALELARAVGLELERKMFELPPEASSGG